LLIDQRSLDPAGLAQARNVVAELFRLELSDSADILIDVTTTLAAWLGGEEQSSLRRSIAAWIVNLQKREFGGVTFDEIEALLEGKAMGERFVRKYATWADALRDEGRKESIEIVRTALKRLLARRFGEVPAAAVARIDEATGNELERWFDRVLDAGSVDAVLSQ
jgi:Arc/MetJ-type ribon-helix-helix transcriptional regulator